MTSLKKQFGARIKEIREKKGLNQEQLAELVGMESRHLSRIETGKSFTTIENISKIAASLKVDVKSLFSFRHKNDKTFIINDINKYLNKAKNSELELVYRIVLDIFN